MKLRSLILLLFTSAALWAQPKFNSPYSRFGIGDVASNYFANQAGWGGQTAAFHDAYHLNLANPASFAFLRSTALETGIFTKYSQYASSSATQNEWNGNLAYLALGFTLKSPINEVLDKNKTPWNHAMGISLTPYSRVGYNIVQRDTLPNLEDIEQEFTGSGGLFRLAWTGATKYKNTAFGINLGWVFGKSTYANNTQFYDTSSVKLPTFQDNIRQDLASNGFVWNAGIQHDIVLERSENDKDIPTRWITLGLSGNGQYKLKSYEDRYQIRSRGQTTAGGFVDADTLSATVDQRRTTTLPSTLTFGIQYVKANKLKVGAQAGIENWSNYSNEARPETLRNTFSFSGGAEYIPDYSSYNHFLRRMRYRAGFYYRQDPRTVSGANFNDMGLTLGLGMPVILPRQQASFVNLALEIGKIGADSPIEETYFRLTAGFTLNDNTWFFKRRFE